MKNRITFLTWTGLLLLLSLLLGACAPSKSLLSAKGEPITVKMALLPILDTLPLYAAQQEGLFEKYGVKVEFIPVSSAAERDQVIMAGQADGMINELVSTVLYNKEQIQVQVVRFARTATSTHAQYRLLASAKSGITNVGGLKGVEIGISQGTVIEYLTDRLLQAEGLKPEEIKTIAVPKIDARMTLLASGELKAAMMPDPMSFLAEAQGAVLVLDDTVHPEYAYSTFAFRKAYIDQHPQAIRGFLAAIEEATGLVNATPDRYSNLLIEKKLVPKTLEWKYDIGPYPAKGVPSEAQWNDVLSWAKQKGLVSGDISYKDSVTPNYLP